MANNINVEELNPKKLTNPELVEAMEEMRKNSNQDTQNKVINIVLRSTFLIPCTVNKDAQLIADEDNHVHFDERPQVKFLLVTHPQMGTFFPVFTDEEELKTFRSEKPYKGFAMKFSDLATLTEQTPSVKGFVINPMHQNLPFTKELLAIVKEAIAKAKKELKEKGESTD